MDKEVADETGTDLALISGNDRESSPLVEITTHIREYQALALEILENAERQRLGRDFDKAQLIQEALDLLIEKRLVAVRLAKNNQ